MHLSTYTAMLLTVILNNFTMRGREPMRNHRGHRQGISTLNSRDDQRRHRSSRIVFLSPIVLWVVMTAGSFATAQVNVVTGHNDIARTGQNLNETILTPANVNPNQFGKLFSQAVTGGVLAQPLYVSQVAIPNKGVHNVVYVATNSDYVYAFDADTNGGGNANPLWKDALLTNSTPAGTLQNEWGVVGTPVIDLASNTLFLVSSEDKASTDIFRLHALDITTGAEKLGGPVQIGGSVPGTGAGSVQGVLTFKGAYEFQRPALLLLNGVIYVGFGSLGDQGPWHGWLFSYNESTLRQIDIFCATPNGLGGGFWMGGAGLAAEVNNPAKPYGRMFASAGNGTYSAAFPYSSSMNFGMSVLDFDLTGGILTVVDEFTPHNEAALDAQDGDLGAGGPVLLPTQTLASGSILNPLVEIGKSGLFYILDRDNNNDGSNNPATEYSPAGLGGFGATADQAVQEVQTPITAGSNWGAGVWGSEAYWNNNIYTGGTNSASTTSYFGSGTSLAAYSFVNGVLSTAPTSQSVEQYQYPGPTPSISANGTTAGILWAMMNEGEAVGAPAILLAYDATNLANTLYSSNTNPARDNPGLALKFTVPTIANGKVYVGTSGQLSFYGLLGSAQTAPAPIISPASSTYSGTQTVTITDAVAGATIYYTTDGSAPTSASTVYTAPLVISTDETITAIASPAGYLQSPPSAATFTSTSTTANPVFSMAAGTYSGPQALTITDASPGAVIYYTLNGSTPTTKSAVYPAAGLTIPVSETIEAIAVAPGLFASQMVSSSYTIQPVYAIDFSQGFTNAQGPMQFNGETDLDDFRLQLTDGGWDEASSAFFATPVNIQAFTTDFTFQLSNPVADGMTFTIQNTGPRALGSNGQRLGYGGIKNSLAIKFDLYNNPGEGPNSTGLFLDGAKPTVPAINLTGTGINLHSGDYIDAHITYDGVTLAMTLTDNLTLATWSTSWPINIPSTVGGNTAYVGFTGGTGTTSSSSQKVTYWTYVAGPPFIPNYPTGFDGVGMTLNGGTTVNGTQVLLTDGNPMEARSAFFTTPVNIQQFATSFNFEITDPNSDGFTFAIQGLGPTAVGGTGYNLGYGGIPASIAVKFDIHNNEGEGPDSTGLYLNGATPTIPATDLTPTGINLHSGDLFNALLTYNGTTLVAVITDLVTNASATETYTVNIPSYVGGPTAYVGFTGGTGGTSSIQGITNWTYSTGNENPFFAN
jgi:hypothetical protein